MLTRSKTNLLYSLFKIKSNTIQMNKYINLVKIYIKNNNKNKDCIVNLCLTDEQLNKITNKKIIIYHKNYYEYAEFLSNEKIIYDKNTINEYNKNYEYIINSIENNLLDDITIDMLVEDVDVEAAKILLNFRK